MRDFRCFQGGVFTSILVYNMLAVANGWYVYDQTHNPMDLGWVGLAQFLPAFLMTFVSGQLADRFDRRRLMIAANFLMAGCALLLWWLSTQTFSRSAFLTVIGLVAIARSLEAPSAASFLPDLVGPEIFTKAVAGVSSLKQISKLAGPAMGGLLYGLFQKADAVFLLCAAGSMLAALFIAAIQKRPALHRKKAAISWQSFVEGLSFVLKHQLILAAISLDMVAVLLGGAVALLPVYAKDILHAGPMGLGLLRSAPAVGAFGMAFWLARGGIREALGKKLVWSVFSFGLLTCLFGISQNFYLSLIVLATMGAVDNFSVVLRQSLVQIATPDGLRGRVSAVNQAFIVTSNQLGEFESGLAASLLGTVPSVIVGGIGTCLTALFWPQIFPALKRFHDFEGIAPSASAPQKN